MVAGLGIRRVPGGVGWSFGLTPDPLILANKINNFGHNIRDFRPAFRRAIKEVMAPSFKMNFHKHGRPRWPELSETTEAIKGHARPLVRTGELLRVVGLVKIWHLTRYSATVEGLPDNVWYGAVHQLGAASAGAGSPAATKRIVKRRWGVKFEGSRPADKAGRVNIPARPFLMFQPEDYPRIHQIFDEWLDEQMAEAGL